MVGAAFGSGGPDIVTRWLITGASGMLGRDLQSCLNAGDVTALDRSRLDVRDPNALEELVPGHDVVVNCAAWTDVDAAEANEADAFAVNATGAASLARACARHGASLLHISTDYVFSGRHQQPILEGERLDPRSAYGRTKAAGEWAIRAELPDRHWILRTAWLYGAHGPNFVKTMVRLEGEQKTVDVVDDQRGQPTWTGDLARRIIETVASGVPAGTYHATNSGAATWHELARAVYVLLGADPDRVRPITSDELSRPAPRPASSVLAHAGWANTPLPPMRPWQDALTASFPVVSGARPG